MALSLPLLDAMLPQNARAAEAARAGSRRRMVLVDVGLDSAESGRANLVFNNTTGVRIASGADTAVVRCNDVYGNVVGINSLASSPTIIGNRLHQNQVGMSGTGILGADDWSAPNDIFSNVQAGLRPSSGAVVRFNRIHANPVGIDAGHSTLIHNNVLFRNTDTAILVDGKSNVQVVKRASRSGRTSP